MEIRRTEKPLKHWKETVRVIGDFAIRYQADAFPLLGMDAPTVFRFVADLPYVADPIGKETVSRPLYTLDPSYEPRDCDDKTVLIGAWAEMHGHPWRIVVVGKGNRPHHVFPEVFLAGDWIPMDATYSKNEIGVYPRKWKFRKAFNIKHTKTINS